jgi:hypothetical protein
VRWWGKSSRPGCLVTESEPGGVAASDHSTGLKSSECARPVSRSALS